MNGAPLPGELGWRCVRACLLGLALFAWLGHAILAADATVPAWLLFACVGVALAIVGRDLGGFARGTCRAPVVRAPRWLLLTTLAVAAGLLLVLGYGALATGDRDWDGIVAWGLKANALRGQATLLQPLFADPSVFHHSPDYPLLQPLAIAAIGRVFLPLCYALLVALAGLATHRRTGDGALACLTALAVALVPDLVGTGGGAVDSGYAECCHALALATAAAALLLDDALLLLAGAVLLPFVKPEGTVHLFALATAATALAPLRACATAVLGGALALALWLPLQLQLAHAPAASDWLPLGIAGAACMLLLVRLLLRGRRLRAPTAWLLGGCAAALTIGLLVVAEPLFAQSRTVLLGHYLGNLERAAHKLPAAATILGGLLQTALAPRRFGLLFVLLPLLACLPRRSPPAPSLPSPSLPPLRPAVLFFALLLLVLTAAFFLSPEPDVGHHLRSSAPRLLLQLTGAGWLLAAAALAPRLQDAALPRWLAAALGRRPAT